LKSTIVSSLTTPSDDLTRMASLNFNTKVLLLACLLAILLPSVSAFGAGNIASISKIEGINWRHGDIEDMLNNIAFIHGHKWTSNMIKRVYFGNWLRDYSQAIDVGSLKGVQKDSIRVIVWLLCE
jgi:Heterokaryon incompatibility protein Het-C